MGLAAQIKNMRKVRNLSIEELAKRIEVKPATLEKWENNDFGINHRNEPRATDVARLAAALEVSTDYLLTLTTDPSIEKWGKGAKEDKFKEPL